MPVVVAEPAAPSGTARATRPASVAAKEEPPKGLAPLDSGSVASFFYPRRVQPSARIALISGIRVSPIP